MSNCYFNIYIKNESTPNIVCTPSQEFFCITTSRWIPAYSLKEKDFLLSEYGEPVEIGLVELIQKPIHVFSIEIADTHTFFVGKKGLLTHNMVLPAMALSFSIPFGEGAALGAAAGSFFGPLTLVGGFVFGGLLGLIYYASKKNPEIPTYQLTFDPVSIKKFRQENTYGNTWVDVPNELFKESKINLPSPASGAQAPGMPSEKDGYLPPKKWDGKKIKHPQSGKVGWPDRNGNVWVPTGTGPLAHGGPHWDVQHASGKGYDNVFPGGKVRKGKK